MSPKINSKKIRCVFYLLFLLSLFSLMVINSWSYLQHAYVNQDSLGISLIMENKSLAKSARVTIQNKGKQVIFKERKFSEFSYPLDINITDIVNSRLENKSFSSKIQPINSYPFKYLIMPKACSNITLLFMVKSKFDHYSNREAIRMTWGNASNFNFNIRTLFVLGREPSSKDIHVKIQSESKQHDDILLLDEDDNYFNNTYKMTGTLKWVATRCPKVDFTVIIDDDYYASPQKILDMLQKLSVEEKKDLLMGYLFTNHGPHRNPKSKWFVSVSEYPFGRYPSFLAAGTIVLSKNSLQRLQIASEYVKWYRLDDVFMGIVAYKLGIKPRKHEGFFPYRVVPSNPRFKDVLTAHGYPASILKNIWNS